MDAVRSEAIPGLVALRGPRFTDQRGLFVESFAPDWQLRREDGGALEFVEDDYSVNRRGVIRGLHGDDRTWKLVSCAAGACFLVVVDLRRGPDAAVWESFDLDGVDPRHILIPAGCATGFASLEEPTIFTYKQSERYTGDASQFTIRWDDPDLAIPWPVADPILSDRDAGAPPLRG